MIGGKITLPGVKTTLRFIKTWEMSQKTGNAPVSTPQGHESKGCGKPVPAGGGLRGWNCLRSVGKRVKFVFIIKG